MTDRKRGRRIENTPPTPIDAAISAAERRQMEEELARLERRVVAEVPVLTTPHAFGDQAEVIIEAVPGDLPTMLVWDGEQGAFRSLILPDGSRWRLVPDRAGIWTPGGRA